MTGTDRLHVDAPEPARPNPARPGADAASAARPDAALADHARGDPARPDKGGGELARGLALAACALVGPGAPGVALAAGGDWSVDTSWLSYIEADDRVAVSKSMGTLTRTLDDGSIGVSLVHDTMSGASPTGAIRSDDSAVTYSGASGGGGFAAGGGDRSMGWFDDTRVQAGLERERELRRTLTLSYGGVVSQESDYDSFGLNVALEKERADRLASVDVGLAVTADEIYRSGTGDTPEPLADTGSARRFESGRRQSVESRLGASRVLNRRTVAQASATVALSRGYHSDPYKVVSVADESDRIVANLHDSRPDSRLRTSLQARLVHQLRDSTHSLHLGYRLYRDDWGVLSNTVDARLRYTLSPTSYLEPHLRLYRQSAADFHVRKLDVDASLDPILPDSGYASADYRLDGMRTATLGLKYGVKLGKRTELRLRAELLDQRFDVSDHDSNRASVFQTSLRHRF